jgi:hypothetical protein
VKPFLVHPGDPILDPIATPSFIKTGLIPASMANQAIVSLSECLVKRMSR